jgi:hypothetical protein
MQFHGPMASFKAYQPRQGQRPSGRFFFFFFFLTDMTYYNEASDRLKNTET